jgi:hypothetical protein
VGTRFNLYNRTVRAAKKLYYDMQFLVNQSNLKKTWELIFEVIKRSKNKSNTISSLLINNVSINDPLEIANEFNKYFANIASAISENVHPAEMPDSFFDPAPDQPTFEFSSTPVTHAEIIESISKLQIKNTLDCNGLSTCLLSKISLSLSVPLQHVVSLSLNGGIVPAQLKVAKITPIFKSGDKLNPDAYFTVEFFFENF